LVLGVLIYYEKGDTTVWIQFRLIKRLLGIAGLVSLGAVSYFATLMLLGFKPRDYMRRVIH
jgi:putative peptidoglycan lipid II flippase